MKRSIIKILFWRKMTPMRSYQIICLVSSKPQPQNLKKNYSTYDIIKLRHGINNSIRGARSLTCYFKNSRAQRRTDDRSGRELDASFLYLTILTHSSISQTLGPPCEFKAAFPPSTHLFCPREDSTLRDNASYVWFRKREKHAGPHFYTFNIIYILSFLHPLSLPCNPHPSFLTLPSSHLFSVCPLRFWKILPGLPSLSI